VRHRAILVFDPDVASLAFVAMALRRRGYEPVCAGSLEQASALLNAAPSVKVAICFLRAGDLGAPALLATLKARPDARVIAVTAPGLEARAADVAFVGPVPIVMLLRAVKGFAGVPSIAPPDSSAESAVDLEPKRNRAK
jgi:DNA-binding NtrC family response regulator